MSSRALKKLHRSDRSEPKDEEEVDALEPFKARSSAFALVRFTAFFSFYFEVTCCYTLSVG